MPKKLKKFSQFFCKNYKKGVVISLIALVVFGLFLPILPAQAQVGFYVGQWIVSKITGVSTQDLSWLGKVGREVLDAIVGGFFLLLFSVGTIFLAIAGHILAWVISPDFISLKFTDNPFVNEGWDLVRDLANMGFILVLVVIGIATSLRIKEYEARKTLPLLIGIAILINFTPVICGFIIDACNIIMNFFLSSIGTGFSVAGEKFLEAWANYKDIVLNTDQYGAAGYGFAMALFVFITAFTYLIYAVLFIVRYVALWILVILSPIVFFCYILPATRGAWSMWWKQFTQWCFVGIAGGFFLYLAERMNALFTGLGISAPAESGDLGFISSTFPYLVPVVFLIIGLFVTLSTSATGASYAISGATKVAQRGGAKALKAARGTKTGQKMEEWSRGKLEQWRLRPAGEYRKEKQEEIGEMEKRIGTLTTEERKRVRESKLTPHREKIAAQGASFEKGELSDQEALKYLQTAKTEGLDIRERIKKRPEYASAIGKTTKEQVQSMAPLEFRQKVEAKSLENSEVLFAMDKQQAKEIVTRGSREQREKLKEYRESIKRGGTRNAEFNARYRAATPEERKKMREVFREIKQLG